MVQEEIIIPNKIYCMDNIEGMKLIPDNSVDLTVTSPPYDNLRKYDGFSFDFEGTAEQLFRITKHGGVLVWVVSDATIKGSETGTSFRQALFFKELGFRIHDTMIYKRWSGPLTHNRYEQEFEFMFVLSKGRPKTFNPIMIDCKHGGETWSRDGAGTEFRQEKTRRFRAGSDKGMAIKKQRIDGNIWELSTSSQKGERFGHPAPFPEELARRHIISWSNQGDLVFDPFLGSGTTVKVAKELGRDYLGFDISEKYVKIAEERLNDKNLSG